MLRVYNKFLKSRQETVSTLSYFKIARGLHILYTWSLITSFWIFDLLIVPCDCFLKKMCSCVCLCGFMTDNYYNIRNSLYPPFLGHPFLIISSAKTVDLRACCFLATFNRDLSSWSRRRVVLVATLLLHSSARVSFIIIILLLLCVCPKNPIVFAYANRIFSERVRFERKIK